MATRACLGAVLCGLYSADFGVKKNLLFKMLEKQVLYLIKIE
jgi:hypothetical protein